MLHVKIGAIGEGLPPPMSSNGRLRHTCQLHSGGTTATKRVSGIVVWRLAKVVADPAADATCKGHVGKGSGRGGGMEEEGKVWLTELGGYTGGVGVEGGNGTERIITADDGDGRRDEGGFAEGKCEVDTPLRDSDLLSEKA
jgi:hypothetical protein